MEPTATYRLQLHAGFTFVDAAEIVPYVADLGVSHLYLSPILTAVPGSEHGYDVLDHDSINPELGGRLGLEALARAAREAGLGIVVDVVPNHMAMVAPQWSNPQLWRVLREGRLGPTAPWFDIDWDHLDGRLGLPVLGESLEEELAAGNIRLDTGRDDEGLAAGQPVARYYDHVFPVAPSTQGQDLPELLAGQHYLLASWREAGEVLNYRRFFEVDELIAVRVEESDVFERTHRLLLELHHSGVIDGFRIDHPDGLADPAAYLDRLASACLADTPIWVEKILEGTERLPQSWRCAGTTGYDANAALSVALVDPSSAPAVTAAWGRAGGEPDLDTVIDACKREAVDLLLVPEVQRLHRQAVRVLPHDDPGALREALIELLVAVDVYRAYVTPGPTGDPGIPAALREAVDRAVACRPELAAVIRRLARALALPEGARRDPVAAADLSVRFQQTTGPVMAKGIEDTAFYRWHRLVALNEVGADPALGAAPGGTVLHDWAAYQAEHWPRGMTTLSTHDTKRSEDVRARILAVVGDAAAWDACTDAFAAAARKHRVDGPTAHLLWQTLVGAGDIDQERLDAYLTKAMREAKEHTSWVEPAQEYEARVTDLAREALSPGRLHDVVAAALAASESAIRAVTLGQKLLQLTLPGVPDTYQGDAVLDLSLVDPDNRRPVDYADRVARLARLDAGEAPTDLADEIMWVTSRALRLRARLPEAFGPGSGYAAVTGGEHVLGFLRGDRVVALSVRAPHGLRAAGGWGKQRFTLPDGEWVDELSGATYRVSVRSGVPAGPLAVEVFSALPVALLVRQPDV